MVNAYAHIHDVHDAHLPHDMTCRRTKAEMAGFTVSFHEPMQETCAATGEVSLAVEVQDHKKNEHKVPVRHAYARAGPFTNKACINRHPLTHWSGWWSH
jgi:hypothetical protein